MRRIVRLVHITTVPQSLGFVRGQAGFMRCLGFDAQAISSPGNSLDLFGEHEYAVVHAVEMPRQIMPFHDVRALLQLWCHLHRIHPVIVHAHTPKGGILGMVSAWCAHSPIRIYHMRGLPYMTASGWRRLLLQWTEKLACRLAHEVLCVSHSLREVAVADGICPPEKIRVLLGGSGNGVDASGRFTPDHGREENRLRVRKQLEIPDAALVVGFVGRIVRDKGLVELVAAWRDVRQEFPEAHLLVVGPFEPRDPIPPDTEARLRADARVHLLGAVDETPPLYAAMDLVVLPTYREGFPNVPLEAAAMELPVVATRIPGCVDAVQDGVTGTLVPPRDAAALAEAIRSYLADPELRREHGRAGRERVLRDFRQEDIWEAIYQTYVRLLREKGIPVPEPVNASATGPVSEAAGSPAGPETTT